jgi:hypothetical protein
VDLLNNEIGRAIGAANPDASIKELAGKTIDEFQQEGLWLVSPTKAGEFEVNRARLTPGQANSARSNTSIRGRDGRTNGERQNVIEAAQEAAKSALTDRELGVL